MAAYTTSNIKLIVYDFDGVMTDNTVIVDQNGVEAVRVSRADSLAVGMFKRAGISQLILSMESNKVVAARARKLGLPVIQGCCNKRKALLKFCGNKAIALDKVLYVGNDVNDYDVMNAVGFRVCPADAHPCIRKISGIVTKKKGGEGVIRELAGRLGAAKI